MASPSGAASRAGQSSPADGTVLTDRLSQRAGSWTWFLAGSITTLVLGTLALVWPDVTIHVLGVLIGLYLLVTGVFRFVTVFGRRDTADRFPGLLVSLLLLLGGVLCLRHPFQTVAALSLVVGAVWLLSGVIALYGALAAEELPSRGLVAAVAALGIVAGIVVLALPAESARVLTRLTGLWLVLLGLAETALALAWRSSLRRPADTAQADDLGHPI
ncbi:HdeD family acid-resistance protein [Streptomyces sp. NPDC056529]|uniref:HdeD family acid-resistance protein n=1 Tax=Streptomyces sp. NPDC056529 TaxID=3345855 RepID=UPI0036BAEB55